MQKYKIYGNEIRFKFCPICGKEKNNPDFSVNYQTGQYYCQTTGQGGLIDSLEFSKEVSEVCEQEGLQLGGPSFNTLFRKHFKPFNKNWLNYLASRGIRSDVYKHVCCMDLSGRMMIPVCGEKQNIVGIKYRTIDKKLTAEKGSSYDYLLNWPQIQQFNELVIVEGEIDLLSVLEAGYPFVVSLAGGASNIKFADTQAEWLGRFKKIILANDNDAAGERCKQRLKKKLGKFCELYEVNLAKYKDFNEVLVGEGPKRVLQMINSATKIENECGDDGFFEANGVCYSKTSKRKFQQITDFQIDISGYSDNFLKGVVRFQDGREKSFFTSKSNFTSPKEIIKATGGWFFGPQSSVLPFVRWIFTKTKAPVLKEIEYYGIVDGEYYSPYSEAICDKQNLEIIDSASLSPLSNDSLNWLKNNILKLRKDPCQSLLGVAWALGRLHTLDRPYPVLEVCGSTSIGKTEYIEFICRLLQGTRANIKNFSTMTNHQIRTLGACSNITPLAIDEVKISSKFLAEKAQYLYSAIRTLYDGKQFDLGNPTSKLERFLAKTPLIVSGESELSDNSIKNRMISVNLTLNNKTEWDLFEKFKTTDILEQFGSLAIKDRLENGEIVLTREACKMMLPQTKDDRQFYNACCLIKGLKALNRILGDIVTSELQESFISYLGSESKENIIVENFESLLELVRASSYGDSFDELSSYYICDENIHAANFHKLYTKIKQEHLNANSTIELLDERALKKQLKEVGYIVDDRYKRKTQRNSEHWVKFVPKKSAL